MIASIASSFSILTKGKPIATAPLLNMNSSPG
jgi:hypothetical protein